MLISVNICLYNSTKYIQETLDSVFAQTYQDFEIIAIDDGSSDSTYEFIKERYNDPRLKLYRQENHGLAYTRNRCISLSCGEYIAFLDHDDVWMQDKLERQVEAVLKAQTKPYMVFGDSIVIDDKGVEKYRLSENKRNRWKVGSNLFESLIKEGCVCGLSSVMARRDVFSDDIRFEKYKVAEEFDVWLKIAYMHPTEFAYVPIVVFKYRWHNRSATFSFYENMFTEPIELYGKWLGILENDELKKSCFKWISDTNSKYAHWLLSVGREKEASTRIIESLISDKFKFSKWVSFIKFWIKYFVRIRQKAL